jgi:hypothetical protein
MILYPTGSWQPAVFGIFHIGFWFGSVQCIQTPVGIHRVMRLALLPRKLERSSSYHKLNE